MCQFSVQKVKGQAQDNDAYLSYTFTYVWRITRRPAGSGASGGFSADCKLRYAYFTAGT